MQAHADSLDFAPPREPAAVRAFVLAVIAHLLLMAALTWGINWNKDPVDTVAEAELWSSVPREAAPPPPPRAVTPPPPVVAPPPPAPPAPPVAAAQPPAPPVTKQPDIAIEREKKRREEAQRKQEEAEERRKLEAQKKKEQQEEARREREQQEKLAKDRARKEQEQKLAQEKARKAQEQKQEEARREREQEEKLAKDKARKEQEQKLAQEKARKDQQAKLADAKRLEDLRKENLKRMLASAGSGSPDSTGSAQQSAGPSASYGARIRARVKPNIVFTDDVAGNPSAEVEVKMSPDGTIIGRRIMKSSGVRSWDEAVLRALDRTEVLPRDTDGRVHTPLIIEFKLRG